MNLRHADHRRITGMQLARHHGLQGQHQLAAGHQAVGSLMRHRRVAAVAAHGDFKTTGSGHHRAGHDRHFPGRNSRPVVQSENGVHRELLEQPLFNHPQGAASGLLGGLEDEMNRAVEIQPRPVFAEVAGGTEQHRGMPVVAAGVHPAGVDGTVSKIIFFHDRQRIHVGAQADGARAAALAQSADNAGSGQATVHFQPIGGQLTRYKIRRSLFHEGQFRVGMQLTPDSFDIGNEGNVVTPHVCSCWTRSL